MYDYAKNRTYVASTKKEVETAAKYILASFKGEADYMKLNLPTEENIKHNQNKGERS